MRKYKDGMICLACGTGTLTGAYKDLPWKFGIFPMRHKTTFKNAKVFDCDICSESFLDQKTNERINLWVEECRDYESNS